MIEHRGDLRTEIIERTTKFDKLRRTWRFDRRCEITVAQAAGRTRKAHQLNRRNPDSCKERAVF